MPKMSTEKVNFGHNFGHIWAYMGIISGVKGSHSPIIPGTKLSGGSPLFQPRKNLIIENSTVCPEQKKKTSSVASKCLKNASQEKAIPETKYFDPEKLLACVPKVEKSCSEKKKQKIEDQTHLIFHLDSSK